MKYSPKEKTNKNRNHTISRHNDFIDCFSADKIDVAENRMITDQDIQKTNKHSL